jgi:hypothetical protein
MNVQKRPQTQGEQVSPGQVQDKVKKEFVLVEDTNLKAFEVCFLGGFPNRTDRYWEPRFSGFQLSVDLDEGTCAWFFEWKRNLFPR